MLIIILLFGLVQYCVGQDLGNSKFFDEYNHKWMDNRFYSEAYKVVNRNLTGSIDTFEINKIEHKTDSLDCGITTFDSPILYENKIIYNLEGSLPSYQYSRYILKPYLYIVNSRFINESVFRYISFNSSFVLQSDTLDNGIYFYSDSFIYGSNNEFSILFCKSRGSMAFTSCYFAQKIQFYELETQENTVISFDKSILPERINFDHCPKLNSEVDFSNVDFDHKHNYDEKKYGYRKHLINLYKSNISKFHLDYTHFKLDFPSELPLEEKKSMYEALLKNFKDRGQMDSYELLDIEYHDLTYGNSNFIRYWNFYGYKKWMVFLWLTGFIFIYTIITYFSLDNLNGTSDVKLLNNYLGEPGINTPDDEKCVYKIAKIPQLAPRKETKTIKEKFRRLWYSFMYTSTIFFLLTLKVENINFKKAGVLYLILVYSSGILCLGYLANFVLQK